MLHRYAIDVEKWLVHGIIHSTDSFKTWIIQARNSSSMASLLSFFVSEEVTDNTNIVSKMFIQL